MRVLLKYILLLVCAFHLPVLWAETEQAYPIITYTCDKKADVLKIKNEVKWGEAGKNFPFSDADGTYNPWEWVQVNEKNGRTLVRQSKSVELVCELSGTSYKVILEPKLFNPDFNAQCGNKLSAKVSIYMGQALMLARKELEKFCRGNAEVIRGIKVYGKDRKAKLYKIAKHKFY